MTDPQSDNSDPLKPSDSKPSRKPEKQGSGNLLWYLIGGSIAVLLLLTLFGQNGSEGEELTYGQFMQGLEGKPSRLFDKSNVHGLVIGIKEITFQDQPLEQEDSSEKTTVEVTKFHVPVYGIGEVEKGELVKRLKAKKIDFKYEEAPSELRAMAVFLILPVMFFIFFIFLFRKMSGGSSAMSFGRSKGKLAAQEDSEISFDDVAGIQEAEEELREVVDFLQTPDKYQALGGRIPRGVLLVGPPGTGKTLLAKAVAGEANVPFFSLSGSDFVEMYVGVGAARVRDMFQQAGERSPSIIFIDELDALGKVRGSGMPGGHDEREQTLNALLVEMDGFSSDQSVIVMAATNRPETLDPALLRPGRFDRTVTVDRPDVGGREQILKVHAKKIKMDNRVDLERIARITPGFVGADLANLVNEAALLAARVGKKMVSMVEFEEGIERVIAGLERHSRLIHEDEIKRVSYHECGHALVSCSLPHTDPVHKISIIPRGMGLGYTLNFPETEKQLVTKSELQNKICCLLGGIAAEEIVFKETSTGAQNDLQRATGLARRMVMEFGMSEKMGRVFYSESSRSPFMGISSPAEYVHSEETVREIDIEVKSIITEASDLAYELLSSRRKILDHMAKELIECETMDAEKLKSILDQHQDGPQISPGTFATPSTTEPRTDQTDEITPPSTESADGA